MAPAEGRGLESRRDERSRMQIMEQWNVYIIECRTQELYVGIAKDVVLRVKRHNQGRACRYTKYRTPVKLIYQEPCGNYRAACLREREIKKYSREKKLALIRGLNKFDPSPLLGFGISSCLL